MKINSYVRLRGCSGCFRDVAAVIGAVVFDVGECLVDESREYGTWADWLDVPRHTFSAVFGAVIAKGLDYRETFQVFRPGFDLEKARQQRADAGQPEWFDDGALLVVGGRVGERGGQGLVGLGEVPGLELGVAFEGGQAHGGEPSEPVRGHMLTARREDRFGVLDQSQRLAGVAADRLALGLDGIQPR